MAHSMDRYLAAGAAGADRRLHPGFSSFAVALWRAGHTRPARGLAHNHHTDLDAFSIPAAPGHGRGFFRAAAFGDDGADCRAEKNSRAQRLQYRRWQRRTEAADPPRVGPGSRTAFRAGNSFAFGFLALLDPAQGRALQSLGAAFDGG